MVRAFYLSDCACVGRVRKPHFHSGPVIYVCALYVYDPCVCTCKTKWGSRPLVIRISRVGSRRRCDGMYYVYVSTFWCLHFCRTVYTSTCINMRSTVGRAFSQCLEYSATHVFCFCAGRACRAPSRPVLAAMFAVYTLCIVY